MKRLTVFLASFVVLSSLTALHAMEPFVGEYSFLKSFIFEIQNDARDVTQDTGVEYRIVTQPVLLERCLKVLGLGYNSTPLDMRYHYELMKEKLSGRDGLLNVITKAYNQLIHMLSEIKKYRRDLQHLVAMSFEELQAMELEDNYEFKYKVFLERKNKLIDLAIASVEKEYQEYVASQQATGLPIILQTAFNLPVNAPAHVVDEHYIKYMQSYQDYLNAVIVHATMKNISIKKLKVKFSEVEKVSKAYERYVQKRGQ
jgi:hypothetical protein